MADGEGGNPMDGAVDGPSKAAKAAVGSARAAKAVTGATKTGAAVAGTTAGTALAGPLGTVIAAVLTSKTFWRALASIFCAVFLTIFLISNMVGLVLSHLGFAANEYVANARTEEAGEVRERIEGLLKNVEGLAGEVAAPVAARRDALLAEAEKDFADNHADADGFDTVDEYEAKFKGDVAAYLACQLVENWKKAQIQSFLGQTGDDMETGLSSPYDEIFEKAAAKYGVSAALLKAVGKVESDFNAAASSPSGAQGVMQLMPATAKSLGVKNPFDATDNIMGGAKYLASHVKAFAEYADGLELAIAAYNAGGGAVRRAGYKIPQNGETPNYVTKVTSYLSKKEAAGDSAGDRVAGRMLVDEVAENADSYLGLSIREVAGEGEGKRVEYSILLLVNKEPDMGEREYDYKLVTSPRLFQVMVKALQALHDGLDVKKLLSWRELFHGDGTDEESFIDETDAGGDVIDYDTDDGCIKEVVYYNQTEEPWASVPYGSGCVKSAGCGPTALAIVISTLTGTAVTPEATAGYALNNGMYVEGVGTSHSFPMNAASHWGLNVERVGKGKMDHIVKQLKKGRMAVVICKPDTMTRNGHYIVLTGVVDKDYFTVADPASRERSAKRYAKDVIRSYARDLSEGAFWIVSE